MMNSSLVVNRDLDSARRDLQEAGEHLGHLQYGQLNVGEISRAIEATVRAVGSVALACERLAELPVCDGSHLTTACTV